MLAWFFGIGAMVSLFLSHQCKGRRGILIAKLCADVFWVAHYGTLSAFAGMIPNFVGIFRELVFINRRRNAFFASPVWPALFILTNMTLGVLSFSRWYDCLPIVASAFVTVSLWVENPRLTKCICAPVSGAFLIYNLFVGSYIGVANESIALLSIAIFFIKGRKTTVNDSIFSLDLETLKELVITPHAPISDVARTIRSAEVPTALSVRAEAFAKEIEDSLVCDFEKNGDKMAHVSTFKVIDGVIYVTYYANTKEPLEDPKKQTARFVFAALDRLEDKTFFDLQTVGDTIGGKTIDMVYDSILMQRDADTLFILWTARTTDGNYYRFYCPFTISTKTMGEIGVNRFRVGEVVNDLSTSGIKGALAENGIPCKDTYSDIGIMQKQSFRVENGIRYCYTGLYSGAFTCIIKSADLVTWEYVSQPDFINESEWENATYVLDDKVYYFVRQYASNPCGFLTVYDLKSGTWARPVEIEDCQSRGDFIFYRDHLYLFHAPTDREHIGIVRIDTDDITKSEVVLQAKMPTSCFYPFVDYFKDGELAMSYTVERKHIRLARFTLSRYVQ